MTRGGTKRKIEIKARDTKQQKSVTCSKRRKTVFSKAADLCHLAGANVVVFVPSPAENSNVVYSFSGYCSASEIAECYLNGESPPSPPQVINEGFWWEDPDFHRYRESDDLSQLQVTEVRLLRSKTHLMAFLEKKQNSQIVSNFDRARSVSSPDFSQNPSFLSSSSSQVISNFDENLINGDGSSSYSSDFSQNPNFTQNPCFLTASSSQIVSGCDHNLINGAASSSYSSDFSQNPHFSQNPNCLSSASSSFGHNSYPSFETFYGEPSDNGGYELSVDDFLSLINNDDPSFWENNFGQKIDDNKKVETPLQGHEEEDKWTRFSF